MPPEIVPVTPDRWGAFDAFFRACEPGCYCRWPRHRPLSFTPGDPSNREAMGELVSGSECPGLLALFEDRPVGWCAVGPLSAYPQYPDRRPGAWGIACVLVAPEARGEAVGRALVEAAVRHASAHGAAVLQGPPPWWRPDEEELRPALVRILEACGFRKVGPGARMPLFERRLDEA
jgi:GNAT superfamily N-acetyltransferase